MDDGHFLANGGGYAESVNRASSHIHVRYGTFLSRDTIYFHEIIRSDL